MSATDFTDLLPRCLSPSKGPYLSLRLHFLSAREPAATDATSVSTEITASTMPGCHEAAFVAGDRAEVVSGMNPGSTKAIRDRQRAVQHAAIEQVCDQAARVCSKPRRVGGELVHRTRLRARNRLGGVAARKLPRTAAGRAAAGSVSRQRHGTGPSGAPDSDVRRFSRGRCARLRLERQGVDGPLQLVATGLAAIDAWRSPAPLDVPCKPVMPRSV